MMKKSTERICGLIVSFLLRFFASSACCSGFIIRRQQQQPMTIAQHYPRFRISSSSPPPKSWCRSMALVIPSSTTATTATNTKLHAFLWFGGDKDAGQTKKKIEGNNKNDEKRRPNSKADADDVENGYRGIASSSSSSKGKSSTSLRRVSNIMDNMSSFKSSKRIGERAAAILQDLSNTVIEGSAADGKVKVSYSGQQLPVGIQIDEQYLQFLTSKDTGAAQKELEIQITKAMKDAHRKSGLKLEEKMKSLYTDLKLD